MMRWLACTSLCLTVAFSTSIVAQDVRSSTTTAELSGMALSLVESSPECLLQWQGHGKTGEVKLQMPPPCQFHQGRDGMVRVVASQGKQYILVESARRVKDPAQGCITFIRALAIALRTVRVSPHVSRVATCPPFQWDEMMFTALFEK
jgi:hypothetical protein